MVMAARYQPQRYLIGPTIFPMYWWVMQLALLWCLVIYSVVKAVENRCQLSNRYRRF